MIFGSLHDRVAAKDHTDRPTGAHSAHSPYGASKKAVKMGKGKIIAAVCLGCVFFIHLPAEPEFWLFFLNKYILSWYVQDRSACSFALLC